MIVSTPLNLGRDAPPTITASPPPKVGDAERFQLQLYAELLRLLNDSHRESGGSRASWRSAAAAAAASATLARRAATGKPG